MNRQSIRVLVGALGMALALASTGCGSDDEGGGGATAAEALTSCNAYCDALIAGACTLPLYATAAECKTDECGDLNMAPAKCQGSIKAYYDCQKAKSDICADGCATQDAAILTCAGS